MPKITIIGAGMVGGTLALLAALKNLGDIVLIDIVEGVPQGKALDIQEALPLYGIDCKVKGTNDYKDTKDSDIAVITAGVPRKPGMSRDDLLNINTKIVKEVTENIVRYSPKCIIIVVSNPLDAMTYVAAEVSRFPKNRVIGMAGMLDSARYRAFIAEALKVSVRNTEAMVLGSHGDLMVPLVKHTKVKGKQIDKLLDMKKIDALVKRTQDGGIEIVNYLKTGSAYVAPAASIVEMLDSIINDKKKVLPCTAYCNKEYGAKGIFIGVPAILGKKGVEKIVELDLSKEEKKSFEESVKHIKELVSNVRL